MPYRMCVSGYTVRGIGRTRKDFLKDRVLCVLGAHAESQGCP